MSGEDFIGSSDFGVAECEVELVGFNFGVLDNAVDAASQRENGNVGDVIGKHWFTIRSGEVCIISSDFGVAGNPLNEEIRYGGMSCVARYIRGVACVAEYVRGLN